MTLLDSMLTARRDSPPGGSPRRPRARRLASALLAVALVAALPCAHALDAAVSPGDTPAATAPAHGDFAAVRAAERTRLIERMLAVAEWCHAHELFLERDNTHRQILRLDPENAESRKVLRYARNSDGSWKDPPTRSVQNVKKQFLPELPAKRAEALRPYADTLLAALVEQPQPPEVARSVYDDILAVDPDCEAVRQRLGEVKDGGAWLLAETARGKQRRTEIRTVVKGALESPIEFKPALAEENEAAWADHWTCGTTTPLVRVLGAGGTADCEAIARLVCASGTAFAQIFGIEPKPAAQVKFYALQGADVRAAFIARFPDLDDARKKLFALAPGGGLPIPNSIVLFDADVAKRNDCAVRNAIALLLRDNFRVEMPCGWAYEGLGLYLTRELCGTRLTWYSLANPKTDALKAGLLAPDSNWMNEALTQLRTNGANAFVTAMTKPVAQLDLQEMVLGYAFSAYLLEGRPDQAGEFLRQCGAGKPWTDVCASVLGYAPHEMHERLVRWLQERK